MFVFYLGGGLWGATGGLFYPGMDGTGVAGFVAALVSAGLLVAWRLDYPVPLPIPHAVPLEPPMP
jgi:MFS transporter, YNFM family, putative membrane transport protein